MSNSTNTKKTLPGHYSKASPCPVLLKEKKLLTHPSSSKKTYHIALNIKGTDVEFHPGDSIGVLPQNDPSLIRKFFSLLSTTPDELIADPRSQEEMSAEYYLSHKVNLSRVNSSLIRHFFQASKNEELKEKLSFLLEPENKIALAEFIQGKDLLDIIALLQDAPSSLQELAQFFTPILPRFYSISSSLKTHPDEIHLLVALLSYSHGGETRFGVASHFLCHLALEENTTIPIYVQPAAHFKLPEDPSQNLIMIGPGTGVAPYRAFLQERMHQNASGKNWLFFGERNRDSDFLYEEYWTDLEKQDKLKLDTAFSRDQEAKEYVQHKLLAQSKEVWNWISTGSYLYVCGDASKMAKDVESALLSIFEKEGSMTDIDAKAYLKELRSSRRYMTDVY